MTFNKKLLLAGLAVGITTYMLYKRSKKHEKEKIKYQAQNQPPPQHQQQGHNYGAWAAGGAGAAALGAAGYAAYQHHNSNQSQPPPAASADTSWADLKDWKVIARLLAACVADQYLYPWYDWQKIQYIAQQIANNGALADVAEAWELPPFLAQDLVKLALFDVMFLLDDSASMQSEGHLRRDGLAQILKRAADAAGRLDPDGMEVAWMNTDLPPQDTKIRSAHDAKRLTSNCRYDGRATPMGHALETKLLNPHLFDSLHRGYLKKPVLAIIITDGRPTGSSERNERVVSVIKNAKQRLADTQYGEDALSVTIAAVGNDREAQDWLDSIDTNPTIGDLVDVCSDIRIEAKQVKQKTGIELTPDLHCLKLLLGSIDSEYDAADEPLNQKYSKRYQTKQAKEARFAQQKARLIAERDQAMSGAGGGAPPQTGYGYPTDKPAAYGGGYPQPPPAQSGYAQAQPYPPAGQPQGYPYGGGGAGAGGYPQQPPQQPYGGYPQSTGGSGGVYPPPSGSGTYPPPSGSSPYPPPSGAGVYPPPGGSPYPPPPYSQTHSRDASFGSNAGPGAPDASGAYHPNVGGFAVMPQNQQQQQQQPGAPQGFPMPFS